MFRFRLQQVLDLRERQERELASQLVRALTEQQDAQSQRDTLQAVRNANAERTSQRGQMRAVGELTNLAFVISQLDDYICSADDLVQSADETVAKAKDALTVAFQDRRVLDRLRERHQENHRTVAQQHDRRAMDDIALTRYTQDESA